MPDWQIENKVFAQNIKRLGALDEAGRGPWAGPVVAACVVLEFDFDLQEARHALAGLRDSKKMTPIQRRNILPKIKQFFPNYSLGIVSASGVDRYNILQATFFAMLQAVNQLAKPEPDFLLVDGNSIIPGMSVRQKAIINGDNLSFSIAAASVLAKSARDRIMEQADHDYPGYGFAKHKGYGTKQHRECLLKLGPCPLHRESFAPVRDLLSI